MADDPEIHELRKELLEMRHENSEQFQHGRTHFERLEKADIDRDAKMDRHIEEEKDSWDHMNTTLSKVKDRVTTLEGAKIYAEGFKSGAVWAAASAIAAVAGAAIWLISKMNPMGN